MQLQRPKKLVIEVIRTVLTAAWKLRVRYGPSVGLETGTRVGVVLLSYNRERNLDAIVRSVLKCSFVNRVLLSNNHPGKRTRDFISVQDPRLVLIDQDERQRPGIRWALARDQLADCPVILAIDDDVFLYPKQIRRLIQWVLADPASVHGIAGMNGHQYVSSADETVGHIIRVYATTQDHIARYFELVGRMANHGHQVERIGDDMVISLAAPGDPQMHSAGYILSCRSSTEAGIAVNREDDFNSVRAEIFAEATEARRP